MGWASGFRAGSELAQTAMDTYYDVKKKTEMGNLERNLQRQQEERQAEIDAYNANVAIAQQQPQATQVGIGQQFNPQQSLVMPQQQVPQLRGVNQEAPGQMSPVGGQALGLGVAPTEMSASAVERMRAQQLRGLGYAEEADKALNRALQMEDIEYNKQQDAAKLGLEGRRVGALESQTEANVGLSGARQSLLQKQAKLAGFDIQDEERFRAFSDNVTKYIATGGDLNNIQDQDFYVKANLDDKLALAGQVYDLNAKQIELQVQAVSNKLASVDTVEGMAQVYSNDRRLTPGSYYYVSRDDDTGNVSVYAMPEEGGAGTLVVEGADSYVKKWMFERATDPANAAALADTTRKEYNTLLAEIAQSKFDNRVKATETLLKLYEDDFGAISDDRWKEMSLSEKLQEVEIFASGGLPSR